MKEIDGSILEGGGQILRMAVALSVLQNAPIRINKIRAGRSKPGLAAQHTMGIYLARDICSANVSGAEIGSTSITFKPYNLKGGNYRADIKTAGSVGLLLQVSLPCTLFSSSSTSLSLTGGTNADMAPQIDYTLNVFKPILNKFGADFQCKILKRGFFPAGKGEIKVEVNPVEKLKAVQLVDFGQVTKVVGEAFVAGVVPFKVAEEMATAATNRLRKSLQNIAIEIKPKKLTNEEAFGNGSGINIHATTSTGCILGGSALGNRRVRNNEVGLKAAEEILESVERRCCVDQHLQDQLIIFMALAEGRSRMVCGPVTLHTETAIHIAKMLTAAKFNIVKQDDELNIIECDGVGYVNKFHDEL